MQKCCTWICLSFGDKKLVSSQGWNGTCFLKAFFDLGPWSTWSKYDIESGKGGGAGYLESNEKATRK